MATTNDQAVINLGRLKTYDTLLKAEVAKDVDGLQKQVDSVKAIATSAIETHFGTDIPTADNKPASDWTTNELKKQHLGDVYYVKTSGAAYRYMLDDSGYKWEAIPDTLAASADAKADTALNIGGEANATANQALTTAKAKLSEARVTVPADGLGIDASNSRQQEGDLLVDVISVGLKKKPNGGIAADAQGAYVDTGVIATKVSVDAKQDKLTAGENVTIDGGVISAKDTVYSLPAATKTALGGIKVGANLHVDKDGTLSADVQSTDISGKQDKLIAGNGIALNGATISAKAAAGSPVTVTAAGIGIADGTTSAKGAVRLSDAVDSTSTTLAATAHAVKQAYDLAAGKQSALTFATDDDINAMFASA